MIHAHETRRAAPRLPSSRTRKTGNRQLNYRDLSPQCIVVRKEVTSELARARKRVRVRVSRELGQERELNGRGMPYSFPILFIGQNAYDFNKSPDTEKFASCFQTFWLPNIFMAVLTSVSLFADM